MHFIAYSAGKKIRSKLNLKVALVLELELGFNLVNHIKPRGNPNPNTNMNSIPIPNPNTKEQWVASQNCFKVTRHLCFKNSKNLQLLDVQACNSANRAAFQISGGRAEI